MKCRLLLELGEYRGGDDQMKWAIAVARCHNGKDDVRWRDKVECMLMDAQYLHGRRHLAQDYFQC